MIIGTTIEVKTVNQGLLARDSQAEEEKSGQPGGMGERGLPGSVSIRAQSGPQGPVVQDEPRQTKACCPEESVQSSE